MDWTADGEMTKAQLMRIVALLFALGVLAECASRAPLGVRLRVMGFLRPAEQVAWDFITRQVPELAHDSDDGAAALRLAQRFRALAIMLAVLAERFGRCRRAGAVLSSRADEAAGRLAGPCHARPPAFDTS